MSELVPAVGKAICIEGVEYDSRGREVVVSVRPTAADLGRSLEKEHDSFAVAAGRTSGLTWVSPRYVRVLRSSQRRQGLGALRFMRLLGAESFPRLIPHTVFNGRTQVRQGEG